MSSGETKNDLQLQLARGAFMVNFDLVKAALRAGADVNGGPDQAVPPIVAATIAYHAGMVEFLLDQGADPERPVTAVVPCPTCKVDGVTAKTKLGERALHVAVKIGNVEIVGLLLKGDRADVDSTDDRGYTPLLVACSFQYTPAGVVRLLLEAGADPAAAAKDGCTPLHVVALCEDMGKVDILYSRAPATLNRCTANHRTPLFMACFNGNERLVSKLLSLGAVQPTRASTACPLRAAVLEGFVGVVRTLINERGIRAVGGEMALTEALDVAVCYRRARILRLMLAAGGDEKRLEWASNTTFSGRHLLHFGAGYGYPGVVSVLLEAGADEAVPDSEGLVPLDVIGRLSEPGEPAMGPEEGVAIRRMLQRGPAYRARSWAWPCDAEEAKDSGGNGDGDTAAAAGGGGILSSWPAVKTPCVLGVRIFRPKGKNGSKLFARLVGRYCAKD